MQICDVVTFLRNCNCQKKFLPRFIARECEPLLATYMGADFIRGENTLYFRLSHASQQEKEFPLIVDDLLFIAESYPDDAQMKTIIQHHPAVFPIPLVIEDFAFTQDLEYLYLDCFV